MRHKRSKYSIRNEIQDDLQDYYYEEDESPNSCTCTARYLKMATDGQRTYASSIKTNKVTVCIGPAGCGKTAIACNEALRMLLEGQCNKIIITRPAVTASEEHGYLPGNIESKMTPWLRPITDILENILGYTMVQKLKRNNTIEIVPFAYMRGRTFCDCCIVADEMQNATPEQMRLLLSRLGFQSKLIITGDLTQSDLMNGTGTGTNTNGLQDLVSRLSSQFSQSSSSSPPVPVQINGLQLVQLQGMDIQRDPIVEEILSKLYG